MLGKRVTGSLSWKKEVNAFTQNSIRASLGLSLTTFLLSHMFSSYVWLYSAGFPSDFMLLISLHFVFKKIHSFKWYFGVDLQASVSSLLFSVLGVCMCGKSEGARKREWEGGRVRWSTAVQINECAISGWVSSPLPARPPACTNLRLNAHYTHAPHTHAICFCH